MLNVGPQEILLILVVALVIGGPQRLPELARSIGKGLRSLRVAQDEVRRTVAEVLEPQEISEAASEIRRTGREIREGLREAGRLDASRGPSGAGGAVPPDDPSVIPTPDPRPGPEADGASGGADPPAEGSA